MQLPPGRRDHRPVSVSEPVSDEGRLLSGLRAGDESAFVQLVEAHHVAMVRLARAYVGNDALAEDVVQDVWSAVIKGIDRFEGRSSVRTWLFTIVKNRATSTFLRERRSVPLSSLGSGDGESDAPPAMDRLLTSSAGGAWAAPPRPWEDGARRLLSLELRAELRQALEALPRRQQAVVVLRDVEGLGPAEVCRVLGLTEENQRVLLHRGRARLRKALEEVLDGALEAA